MGETWVGSSARSLCAAIAAHPAVRVSAIAEDRYLPRGKSIITRAVRRFVESRQRALVAREVVAKLETRTPDVLMVYKGSSITPAVLQAAKNRGVFTVNVFPDYSPHAYGAHLKEVMGQYDLVISTKPFHPRGWQAIYGYRNPCVFVPHGYDPAVHFWPTPPAATDQDLDVVIVTGWRRQYNEILADVAESLQGPHLRVAVAGPGWYERARGIPRRWIAGRGLHGRAYGAFLRRGKIAIAPVNRHVVIDGVHQPGDEDTTRTYELAAAGCFFLHQRSAYVQTVYDEGSEVPMWDDAEELAELIQTYLPRTQDRHEMAARAQRRAVPTYSIPVRAMHVLREVEDMMRVHSPTGQNQQ